LVLNTATEALHNALRDRPPIHLKKPFFANELGPLTANELERYTWLVDHQKKVITALQDSAYARGEHAQLEQGSEGDFEQLPTELIISIFRHLDIHSLLK
jgi:hypothetical protein